VWRFLDSHLQLILRSYGEFGREFLQIHFGDIVWMEMGRGFGGGITLTETTDPGQRPVVTNYPFWEQYPLLLTELSGPKGDLGFVAAMSLRIHRMSAAGKPLDLLLSVRKAHRESAYPG
jgi:hypothetical protein